MPVSVGYFGESAQGNERWLPATNPSTRLRAARAMPHWITARGTAIPPPPPPPPLDPPPIEPEYEVIDFGQQTYSNQPAIKSNKEKERKRCDLCGSSVPAVRCMQCVQQNFCYSCDEMYHRHPKRQNHVRREIEGGEAPPGSGGRLPPLPPKGEPPPAPVPPPRRNKRGTPRPVPSPPPPAIQQRSPQHFQSPHNLQRDSVSPKPGFVGSLKRMIGVRPVPLHPHTMDRQTSIPASSSMVNFHDQHMVNHMGNGFQDWTEIQRGHRSGSFSAINQPNFGHMMQAQSMAHLNCPGCHGQGMWTPWGGQPHQHGAWQSQTVLPGAPRGREEEFSDSDSDAQMQRERLRRFSTLSGRGGSRPYPPDDTLSMRGGSLRRRDWDTTSNRGGRKDDLLHRGRRNDIDTMSNRGGRKKDFDTMSLRGGRRSDLESPSLRSRRKASDSSRHRRYDSESSDERESDEEFIPPRSGKRVMSDMEDMQKGRRRSEPPSPLPTLKRQDSSSKKNRRNERFSDTGRRRSSPINYKYESPSDEEPEQIDPKAISNGHEKDKPHEKQIEGDDEEEELAPIPVSEWECRHCTFINEGGTRVCAVCCKTYTKPKPKKLTTGGRQTPQSPKPMSPKPQAVSKALSPPKLEDDFSKQLHLQDKEELKKEEKTEKLKEKRGSPERFARTFTTSTGTSPPPQSISTQTYEEAGRKLKRATSLADYSDWRPPQRSTSRQSLLSDTQSLPATPPRSGSPEMDRRELARRPSDLYMQRSLKRAGSQPPEYLSSLVQKQVKQGLEMVKLLREAEVHEFAAEDLAVALLHCGDEDPIAWLQENWKNMIDTVVTLGTNYGQERKENTVGTISATEAREALRAHDGNVWAAVTECVEQRQRKYAELLSRGNFSREDIVTVLTANHGNLEEAFKELNKNQLKPFLMRIWGPPQGADNDQGNITKLAHGDMEGRGGKNSDEVSVDLSIDSNYERIENWLEDYVHINNKNSQSMLQLNFGGLKRSESDYKINFNQPHIRSSSSVYGERRYSDVHRYLSTLYNANDKSLLLNKHSTSMLSLTNDRKKDSFLNNITNNKDSTNPEKKLSSEKSKSDRSVNEEIETVTIKLNPIVVNQEQLERKSVSSSEESESSSDNEESNEVSKTLKAEPGHLQVENKSLQGSMSGCTSDVSGSRQELTRSNSQNSNESFESVHSSVGAEPEEAPADRLHVPQRFDDLSGSSREHSPASVDYANVSIVRAHIQQMKLSIDQDFQNEASQPHPQRPNSSQKSSSSSNDSEEKYEEVPSDDEIPFIENNHVEEGYLSVPIAIIEDVDPDTEEESHFHSIENKNLGTVKRSNTNAKHSSNLQIPNKRKMPSKRQKQYYALSKSDSDIVDEQSADFSEESLDYNETKRISPLAPSKRDQSLRFSEANSDKDVSSIPTDSEREAFNDGLETNRFTGMSSIQASQAELIELLKKSLTKDDVVERLVSTLFASVLQATVGTNPLNDPFVRKEQLISPSQQTSQGFPDDRSASEARIDAPIGKESERIPKGVQEPATVISQDEIPLIDENLTFSNEEAVSIVSQQKLENLSTEKSINLQKVEIQSAKTPSNSEINHADVSIHLNKVESQPVEVSTYPEKVEMQSILVSNIQESSEIQTSYVSTHQNGVEKVLFDEIANQNNVASLGNSKELNIQDRPKESITLQEQILNESLDLIRNEDEIRLDGEESLESNDPENHAGALFQDHKMTVDGPKDEHKQVGERLTQEDETVTQVDETVTQVGERLTQVDETVTQVVIQSNETQITAKGVRIDGEKVATEVKVMPQFEDESRNIKPISEKLEQPNASVKNEVLKGYSEQKESGNHNADGKTVVLTKESPPGKNVKTPTKPIGKVTSVRKVANGKPGAQKPLMSKIVGRGVADRINSLENKRRASQGEVITIQRSNKEKDQSKEELKPNEELKEENDALKPVGPMESEIRTDEETPLIIKNVDDFDDAQREARRLLAEGLVKSYDQAEIAVQLKHLKLEEEEELILAAANECGSLEAAITFLQQECHLCAEKYPAKQMVSMLECTHVCCQNCAVNYFTLQITEKSINDCVCPFCKEPDILHIEEDKALTYFSHLDIFLKRILKENVHELFQRKLRDRTLMQDPNFKWCIKCSSGFIANPRQKRLVCPDCKAVTCAKCMRYWEKEHENMTCEEYKVWAEENDPENQLAKVLDESGVTCPKCKMKYVLAKGGCMHLTCPQCKYEFCSGCSKPFLMGRKCSVSEYCEKLGLHSHHPRNCLFYLRDKEPEELEHLLQEHNITFNRNEDLTAMSCKVQMLKETSDGLVEGVCGFTTMKAGLCRTHYIESLVLRIRQNKLDPVKLLDFNEALQEVKRNGKALPDRPSFMSEYNYRQILYKVIQEEIPLE